MLEILDTVSKPFVFCWISDFTELKIQRCHVVNKTGTLPHGVSWVAVLMDQHIAKNCLFHVQFCTFKNSIKENKQSRSLHFCEVRNLTKHKWFTVSGILAQIFRKLEWHSFNEDSSLVEMAAPEMPCGKVPVLFTTWHLWIFSSVKSEIQQNTNGLLAVSRISSTFLS